MSKSLCLTNNHLSERLNFQHKRLFYSPVFCSVDAGSIFDSRVEQDEQHSDSLLHRAAVHPLAGSVLVQLWGFGGGNSVSSVTHLLIFEMRSMLFLTMPG